MGTHQGKKIRLAACLLVLGLVGLGLGGLTAGTVRADDPATTPPFAERVAACRKALTTHYRERDARAMLVDVKAACALFQGASEEEGCEKAQACLAKAVGKLCTFRDLDVQKCAVKALGEMGHEAGAPFVKRYLKPVGKRKPVNYDVVLEAIDASGKIAYYTLITPLVTMVDKSKNMAVATKAMTALGKFHGCRRHRCKILKDLMKSLRPHMPGRAAPGKENESTGQWIPGKSGSAGTSRWGALSPVLVTTFNELTGQSIMSAEDWFQYVQDNKQNLQSIFARDA